MLYISDEEVGKLLNWDDTYQAVKSALENVSRKHVAQSARSVTKWSDTSLLLTMPGYLNDTRFGALSCKLVTICPDNVNLEKPLPTISAIITLFDDDTGVLKAVMGGAEITKWRTAAASVVATKYLTAEKNLAILAILGAGEQGHIHALSFLHFFNFKEVRIWNRSKGKAEKLMLELSEIYTKKVFKCYDSNEECVKGADVIITATFASEPIVYFEWLKNGVHINAVGVNFDGRELSDSIYVNSEIFVDHMDGARKELADLQSKGFTLTGEIGSVITGDLLPSSNKITVFQSLGMAVEDGAVARMVYDLHLKTKNTG